MKKYTVFLGLLAILIASVLIFSSSSLFARSSSLPSKAIVTDDEIARNIYPQPATKFFSEKDFEYFQRMDLKVSETDESAKIDKTTAINKARHEFNQNTSKVDAQLVRLSDQQYKNILAWIVRFDGLQMRSHGPGERLVTQLNVVIDAISGKYLFGFAYK
ncbi:hypothetical protein [Desulfitobacterium sp.]|uniref:hypothetical protein n=1 Tax=Desulfitobacterium sp. TaxID=49981 RepID=UPI002BB3AB89|nr:hypothetical protein [Desulfitobacterium sp.]HVJ49629.1 hypothetical protein [Desulfitobacterium sp.]